MTATIATMARPNDPSSNSDLRSAHPLEFAPWPCVMEDEIEAVVKVLRSGKINYWTGEEGRHFEHEFAAFVCCQHAVALSSGTVALELALRALGIGAGDEVITTSRTFIASASCAIAVGAIPIFADVDRDSQNMTAATIRAKLTPRTKAIVAVHLAGWPCEMDEIMQVAREHGLKVVEDCAQALGAKYKGMPVGSIGDMGAFSFCQDKIMTTGGEGGMLTTSHSELWQRAWSFKDHGKSYDAVYNREHPVGFRWLHESFGTNGRMTEMQSAIGRIGLRKVADWVETRRKYAGMLNEALSGIHGLRVAFPPAHAYHAYYKCYAFLRPEYLRNDWTRDRVMEAINSEGIPCFSGSCSEVYLEKAFPSQCRPTERLPIAHELGATSLVFFVHPTLSEDHIRAACAAVRNIISAATRSLDAAASPTFQPAGQL
jgi:dTDP-4-amino-4,6-dideoxygalactose transaminase